MPNPKVSPISLPSVGIKQGQAPEIKSDAKLPSTTQTSTAPTTGSNTSTSINKEFGVVDVSKNPDFRIDIGKQGKHLLDHNNYISGKSILDANPQELLNDISSGNINSMQLINEVKSRVDFGKIIGTYINNEGQAFQTTRAIIVNSKSGIHIIPSAPN